VEGVTGKPGGHSGSEAGLWEVPRLLPVDGLTGNWTRRVKIM